MEWSSTCSHLSEIHRSVFCEPTLKGKRATPFNLQRLEWWGPLGRDQSLGLWETELFGACLNWKPPAVRGKDPSMVKTWQLERGCWCDIQHTFRVISYHIFKVGLCFIDSCFQAFDPQPSALLSHLLSLPFPPHLLSFLTPLPTHSPTPTLILPLLFGNAKRLTPLLTFQRGHKFGVER